MTTVYVSEENLNHWCTSTQITYRWLDTDTNNNR